MWHWRPWCPRPWHSRCSSCHGNPQPFQPQCWWKWGHGSATKCLTSAAFGQSVHLIVKVKRTKNNRKNRTELMSDSLILGKNLIQDALQEAGWTDLNLGTKLSKPGWVSSFCLDPTRSTHFMSSIASTCHCTAAQHIFFHLALWRCDCCKDGDSVVPVVLSRVRGVSAWQIVLLQGHWWTTLYHYSKGYHHFQLTAYRLI